jgi:aspartate/tyrosine/aromatic aminotransferase
MRDRILTMRRLFRESLDARGIALPGGDNGFITRQKGMFSFSGLNPAQVERLRSEHAIYVVGSGRINVAGMSEGNMDRLCAALKAVLP